MQEQRLGGGVARTHFQPPTKKLVGRQHHSPVILPPGKDLKASWNVMAHGDAREGKWRGIWRMEWVASTLHTTWEHGVSSFITADAHTSAASSPLNWRPPADLNGLANGVGRQYPSHYLGTWCIQHYYRWCAHLGCQQSTELTPTGRFKWTGECRG